MIHYVSIFFFVPQKGMTALMAAANSGSLAVTRAILDKGANVNALDSRKNHAAHYAAKGGFLPVLCCLSAYSANFNFTNNEGNNAVHIAAKEGFGACCRFLAQRGKIFVPLSSWLSIQATT